MKKHILALCLILNFLSASSEYELKLYEKILPLVFEKAGLIFYGDMNTRSILKKSIVFSYESDCEFADVIIGANLKNLPTNCQNIPLFSTSYRSFKNTKKAFGAFYWRKGRPQIKFRSDVMHEQKLHLPEALRKFAQ